MRNENNASARYYEVGHRPAFLLDSGAVTIFFKHDSITGRQGYLSKDARGLKNGGHVSIYQIDGNLTARLQSASKSYSIQVPDCIVPNRWNHLVFQWGPGGMTLWLNGQSVGSDPYAGGLGSTSGGTGNEEPFFIGAGGWKYEDKDPSTVVGFFDGEVQLALLHSRKLTPLEIASHVHTSKIAVNRRPYGLTLDQNQISENQSAGTLLGVLSAMDDDYNANLTYALNYLGQGGPFAVQPDGTVITTRPIDYEETPQLELFARVSDEYDANQWKKFVIEVLDLDEVPDTEESPGPQAPGSDKESGENDPAGESPKSEESDGGKGPDTSSPETESGKETTSPSNPQREGEHPGHGEESPVPEMPGSDKESGEEDSDKRPGKPGSEKEDDLSKQPGKPSDSEESDLEKGEGKKPGKDKEETDSQLPEKESVKPEEEESKNEKKARLPIVRTLRFDRDENGTFVLAGKLLADGGGTLEEVGILISEKFSFKDCECKPAEIKGKEGIFRKRLRKLEAGATYYYRAYARNEVGENWGSIRKLKVPKVEERKAWWSESLEMGGGWRQSEWLGAFRKSEGNDWIFHLKLGWVFARPDSGSGLWLWLEEYGWLWTQMDAWPYLWANQSADWLYFVTQLRGEALFLRPSDGQLILQGREFRTGSEKQRETEPSGKDEFTKEPGRSSEGKEKTKRETDQTHPATDERKTQDSAGTSGKQRDVQERGEVARESVTERTEGKSEREEPGDLGREETISQPVKREEGKERATDDSTLGKQTEREISERPDMERESTTDRTADEEPVSDRISGETERDGKLDREQTGNRQTISENRQDLPLEREDLSRERNSESTLILERSERYEP